ncbi:MAG: hypothetical protein JEZ02_10030 [Desulfatibacillum sp.]|nr:hypothetical protein [Desulfatibacillum sp.]
MDNRYAPSTNRGNTTAQNDSDDSGAYGALAEDDDLMGAIGIDLESDISDPGDVLLDDPEVMMDPDVYASDDMDMDDYSNLDPYAIGANVAAVVRQLVSQKIDRIITVAVEQAVAKELRKIQGKRE